METELQGETNYLLYGGIAFLVILVILFKFMKTGNKKPGKVIKKGQTIYIMGECGAGKTALLYKLANQQQVDTVSSIDSNETKVDLDGSLHPAIDIPGHSFSKQKFLKELTYARVILIVVDSTNQESFGHTAEYLYNILIQKDYIDRQIPILLVLNKQDAPRALKTVDFEHLFTKEMERIKKSKRAIDDESEDIDDYIKLQDQMFSLAENNIEVLQCSVQNDEISEVKGFLSKHY